MEDAGITTGAPELKLTEPWVPKCQFRSFWAETEITPAKEHMTAKAQILNNVGQKRASVDFKTTGYINCIACQTGVDEYNIARI
jgi:hypothetical protein